MNFFKRLIFPSTAIIISGYFDISTVYAAENNVYIPPFMQQQANNGWPITQNMQAPPIQNKKRKKKQKINKKIVEKQQEFTKRYKNDLEFQKEILNRIENNQKIQIENFIQAQQQEKENLLREQERLEELKRHVKEQRRLLRKQNQNLRNQYANNKKRLKKIDQHLTEVNK